MIKEKRIILGSSGRINPCSIIDYVEAGGYRALARALESGPEKVVEGTIDSFQRTR